MGFHCRHTVVGISNVQNICLHIGQHGIRKSLFFIAVQILHMIHDPYNALIQIYTLIKNLLGAVADSFFLILLQHIPIHNAGMLHHTDVMKNGRLDQIAHTSLWKIHVAADQCRQNGYIHRMFVNKVIRTPQTLDKIDSMVQRRKILHHKATKPLHAFIFFTFTDQSHILSDAKYRHSLKTLKHDIIIRQRWQRLCRFQYVQA